MLDSVEWEEFILGNFFDKLNLKFRKDKFKKDSDISRTKSKEFNLPLVNAKDGDNGIMYYGRVSDFDSAEMTIDIVNDGAVSTGNVYPQPQRTGVLYNAYLIKYKHPVTTRALQFFSSSIQKSIKLKFGYENKAGWEKVKKEKVQLPVKNGMPDLEFIEHFIAELEARRIAELEAYLSATGLKDTTLSASEKHALACFERQQWAKFNLKKLFGKATRGKRLKSADRISGNLPFVTAGEADTGIAGFIGNDVDIFKANTITIDMFGSAKYRNYEYGGDDHIAVVHTDKLNPMAVLFITAAIHKASYTGQFHYGRNFYSKDADALDIMLPEKNGSPDYQYMQTLLSAVQKLIIKDVVEYADKKIDATRQVIAH